MKKALLHYFTGTGNTARAIGIIDNELKRAGYATEQKVVTAGAGMYTGNYDLHIFAFPVYATGAPVLMRRYMKTLPKASGTASAVLAVYGDGYLNMFGKRIKVPGYAGYATIQAKKILGKQGYKVFFTASAGYPGNIALFNGIPDKAGQEEIINVTDKKMAEIGEKISNGTGQFEICQGISLLWTRFFSFMFSMIGRRFVGKLYIADSSCTSCGKCVRTCPAKVIKFAFNKKPRWNFNCEACQRCINICPTRSIQTSLMRILVILILLSFLPYNLFLKKIFGISVSNIFLKAILLTLCWLISVYIVEKIIFIMECIPGIRKVFEITFTRRSRRYLAPGYGK